MFGSQIGGCKALGSVKSILIIPAKSVSFIRIQFAISVPVPLLFYASLRRGSFTNWQQQEQAI